MDYYYQNPNSDRVGPLDEATFFAHANAGTILFNALVWRSGEENWAPWANVAAAWMSSEGGVPDEAESGDDEDEVISDDLGIDSLFGDAWEIFKRHWGKFILSGMLTGGLVMLAEGGNAWVDSRERAGDALPDGVVFGVAAVSFVFSVISGVFGCGYLKITRKEDAGAEVRLGDIFPLGRCLRKMFKFLGAGLIYMLIVIPIYLLMVFPMIEPLALSLVGNAEPGLAEIFVALAAFFSGFALLTWLMLRLLFVFMFVFDTDCGVFGAFKASWRITRNRFWRTFGYGVLSALLVMFGSLFTLGLGAILLIPLGAVWYAVYYVKLCKNCDDALPESTLLR